MRRIEHTRPIFELGMSIDGSTKPRLPGPLKSALERLLLLRKIDEVYAEVSRADCELHFVERILRTLDISYELGKDDLTQIPREGPIVVIANHPFGIIDGVVLASVVRSVRPDFKLLANFALKRITELLDTLIPVDPYGSTDSTRTNV